MKRSTFLVTCMALALIACVVPEFAFAQTDVTAVTGAFTDATAGVTSVSAVMLGVVAAGIAVKWLLGFIIG